jgi:GT2 family glycosyltransferase
MVDVAAMVAAYTANPKIRFCKNEKRLGIGGNWNACLQKAQGEFLQFLFQDDTWHPRYLSLAVAAMEMTPDAGFVSADHSYLFEENDAGVVREAYDEVQNCRRRQIAAGRHVGKDFLQWWLGRGLRPNVIGEPSFVLLRKSLVDAIGPFREDLPQMLDSEYWLRCLLKSNWFLIGDDLGIFRVHASAASATNQREGRGLTDRLRLLEIALHLLPSGPLQRTAKAAFVTHLKGMIAKHRERKQSGGNTGGSATEALSILLRHPLLTLRALFSR